MKKLFTLIAISTLFFACEDEKEVDVLIGKWFPETILINGDSIPYSGNPSCGKDYLQLNEFNSFEIVNFYETDAHEAATSPCPSEKYYGSYSIINNELKLYGTDFFQGGTIIEKSATTLKLQRTLDVDGDGKNDEVTEVFTKG